VNSRERILASVRGGAPDRKPVIHWPHWEEGGDIRHYNHETIPDHIEEAPEEISLVEITNPFGLALQRDIDLNAEIKLDPKVGNRILGDLIDDVRKDIAMAFEVGADGIIYRLYGARSRHCTPMQYGGHYLEKDRELLTEVQDALVNFLFVVGEDDVYLDFVSDLPAHAFGWDYKTSKIDAGSVRAMRAGALVSEDPNSDILLDPGTAFLSRVLESSLRTEEDA